MRTDLLEDPDVVSISTAVGMDEYSVVGRLLKLWGWVSQHTTDGRNVRVTDQFLDRFVNCSGFCSALRTCNWLSGSDLALTFPKFDRHNSNTAKARALEAEAKKIRRDDSDVGQMSDKKELKCPTRYNSSLISSSPSSSLEGVVRGNHSPPTLEMVVKACQGGGSSAPIPKSEGEAFWHHYEAIGWVTGNNIPVRNWRSKLIEWHNDQLSKDAEKKAKSNGFQKPISTLPKLPSQFVNKTDEEEAIGTIQGLMQEKELSKGQADMVKAALKKLTKIPTRIEQFCKERGLLI